MLPKEAKHPKQHERLRQQSEGLNVRATTPELEPSRYGWHVECGSPIQIPGLHNSLCKTCGWIAAINLNGEQQVTEDREIALQCLRQAEEEGGKHDN